MASTSNQGSAFVWVWLPGSSTPVVAGRILRQGSTYRFGYGRSYLDRSDAISLYEPELPLREGWQEPLDNLAIASTLRDAGPDSWGQKVILERVLEAKGTDADTATPDHITYFMESGSNRVGGLDFQDQADRYVARGGYATLDELHAAADALLEGHGLTPELAAALVRGTSIGGARPKALMEAGGTQYIAKFSSSTDHYPVVNSEAVGFELARRVGINAPSTSVTKSLDKDVLLIERFDRTPTGGRRIMVSGLTMLGLDEMEARYATYPEILDVLRQHGKDPAVGHELFRRIVLNVAIGNNDDHARNHAAFWDGRSLELTPAYDLCPQARSGETSAQAMAFGRQGERESSFAACLGVASVYGVSKIEARQIINHQIDLIQRDWDEVADIARLSNAQRNILRGRQILNPACFYGYQP